MAMRTESEVLAQFADWAQNNEHIRAAILTGSRVNPEVQPDFLSDYDIALFVDDLSRFQENDDWLSNFGCVLVRWPLDPRSTFDSKWVTCLVLFDDGVRIDFQITEAKVIEQNNYDNGYRVLIDKEGFTENLKEPTYTAFNIKEPSKTEYETLVNEFWWDATYVPKYLWRNELPFAKYVQDDVLRYFYLHKLIEWHIGLQHDWAVNTGCYGKWFKRYLEADNWVAYESTYARSDIEENWEAFFMLIQIFRNLGREIGEQLGFEYPTDLDEKVSKYILTIREKENNGNAHKAIKSTR